MEKLKQFYYKNKFMIKLIAMNVLAFVAGYLTCML